jgi:hypothetical protein
VAPGFLSAGLDQTDYVELFAPKPWLITSTTDDFFTTAGARQVFEEAQRWYKLHDVPDRVKWVVGPGGHGTPLEVREAIYEWDLIHPRSVVWSDPTDWMGNVVALSGDFVYTPSDPNVAR